MAQSAAARQYHNHLLSSISRSDLALLEPHLESVALPLRFAVEKPNRPIKHLYFVEEGLLSTVADGPRNSQIEIGLTGYEGVSGLAVVMGDDRSPYHNFVQLAGSAHRVQSEVVRDAMKESPSLQRCLLQFARAFMIQSSHTALANGRAKIEERLAHWIVMAHDRCTTNEINLTHEFLAIMLGVRRPGVTVALNALASRELISSARGRIVVLDRKGLQDASGGLYGIPESEYRRLIGWKPKVSIA